MSPDNVVSISMTSFRRLDETKAWKALQEGPVASNSSWWAYVGIGSVPTTIEELKRGEFIGRGEEATSKEYAMWDAEWLLGYYREATWACAIEEDAPNGKIKVRFLNESPRGPKFRVYLLGRVPDPRDIRTIKVQVRHTLEMELYSYQASDERLMEDIINHKLANMSWSVIPFTLPLIQGSIHPTIKGQLLNAIDEGCEGTDKSDPICTIFRSQLAALPACEKQVITPVYDHKRPYPVPKKLGHRKMTNYQKHVSVCMTSLKEEFPDSTDRWNEMLRLWKSGESMHDQYNGSEFY